MKVHVSSLNSYEFCPRVIYLRDVLQVEPKPSPEKSKGLVGHAIRKELSLRQSKLLGKVSYVSELEDAIAGELEAILGDVPFIYKEMLRDIDPNAYVAEIRPQLENEMRLMVERLSAMIDELGIDKALKLVTPWKVEYTVKSKELKLSGRIDKVMREDVPVPIEIKTGQASRSVWEGDKLQIVAYTMLLEEKFKERIPFGFVEYTQAQEKRPVLSTEQLRRKAIYARDDVIDILNGKVPDICPHGSGKKCGACGYFEVCYGV